MRDFAAGLDRDWYMFSTDVKAAYHSMKVPKRCQQYLCFHVYGQYFCFQSCPFGLAPLCRIFQLLAGAVSSFTRGILGIHAVMYIDDLAGKGLETPRWMKELLSTVRGIDLASARACLDARVPPRIRQFSPYFLRI